MQTDTTTDTTTSPSQHSSQDSSEDSFRVASEDASKPHVAARSHDTTSSKAAHDRDEATDVLHERTARAEKRRALRKARRKNQTAAGK
jgi:hypothetical protein